MSTVTCPDCTARLALLARLGIDASRLWRVGNRDGIWRGCAAFLTPQGRTVLCVARPIDMTWSALFQLGPK